MRRPDRPDQLFIAMAAAAAMVLLALGAGLTFFSDEWAFIESRALGDPTTWFAPHNEHWATIPILVYRTLVETVGLGSYMPYLAVLITLHVTVAALVYVLVRRSSGPWPALAVGVVVLFFGSGFENLYWAFQIGFVGSVASGLAAIAVLDAPSLTRRRLASGVGLLLVSLSTTGVGLIACVAVGTELLLDASRRKALLWLAVPLGVYAAWYLAIGRVGVESREGPFVLGGLTDIPPTIVIGLGAAAGALVGVGTALGQIAVVAAIVGWGIGCLKLGRIQLAPRTAGSLAAILALYGLIAVARSFVGPAVADYTRYTYISSVFLAVGVAAQIGRPTIETTVLRKRWLLLGGMVFVLAMTWNVRLLVAGRTVFAERAERTRALVFVALDRPLPESTDPTRSLVLVPSPASLERIVADHGSPLTDWLVPWAVPPIRTEVLIEARRVLTEGAKIPLPEGADETP